MKAQASSRITCALTLSVLVLFVSRGVAGEDETRSMVDAPPSGCVQGLGLAPAPSEGTGSSCSYQVLAGTRSDGTGGVFITTIVAHYVDHVLIDVDAASRFQARPVPGTRTVPGSPVN